MVRVSDILSALETIAPQRFTFEFDRVGLQVGDPHAHVSHAILALDRSLGAIEACKQHNAQLLLTHHPLIFQPVQAVTSNSDPGRAILELASNRINFIAAHTNWDSAHGGINDTLCEILGLQSVVPFGMGASVKKVKLTLRSNSPSNTFEAALTAAGVTETWASGTELYALVREDQTTSVKKLLARTFPSEDSSFFFTPLQEQIELPSGRIGKLPEPMNLLEFVGMLDEKLNTQSLVWGKSTKIVRSVAITGGAADGDWINAQRAGADIFVTGEVKQHIALAACEGGLAITSSGHYATEQPGVFTLAERMREAIPDVDWQVYEPEPGTFGRPHVPQKQ